MNTVEEDLARLKAATRAAHEAAQEVKDARREAQAMLDGLRGHFRELIEVELRKGLQEYDQAIRDAINQATDAVFGRFDAITTLLLNGTKADRRRGRESVEDLARRWAQIQGMPATRQQE